jgi:hypothetical protein
MRGIPAWVGVADAFSMKAGMVPDQIFIVVLAQAGTSNKR